MEETTSGTSKLEARWMAFITAIALFLGGWWLQNQYTTTLKLHEELGDFMRFADERYVEKDYLRIVTDRLERIEVKIDTLASDRARERGAGCGSEPLSANSTREHNVSGLTKLFAGPDDSDRESWRAIRNA